ncbi:MULTISPECIES: helix-turn-helix domain-containing protein [Corynebacterium]|uniref:helix-turn-helix domain-containing protein n=1 Tax=Corynebacterium TaxID=1716 RepID=UPI000C0815FC|nr:MULTISPECIES: helix-turn-helix domain-containing protein [Corynebacterium]MBF0582244.1 helix-turn-helix transcriptional regulator [Corynebacterium sp. ED61]
MSVAPHHPVAVEVGKHVRAARKRYNLTQRQLSELAELSDKTIRDIEHGTGSPSFAGVLHTLDVLGLDIGVN